MKKKDFWGQVLHKCEQKGEIILVVNNSNEVQFMCKKCLVFWKLPTQFPIGMSEEFLRYEE